MDFYPKLRPYPRQTRLVNPERRCHYCGIHESAGNLLVSDHVIPKSKGGSKRLWNCVRACRICNLLKSSSPLKEIRWKLVLKMLDWPRFTFDELEWLRERGFDMTEFDQAKLYFER